jgi:hypothetical protein
MQSVEHLADYPLFLEGGGQLIRDKWVTGDANELDDLCAIAGIHAAKLCTDSDFFDDPDLVRALSIPKNAPLVDPRPKATPRRSSTGLRAGRNGSGRRGHPNRQIGAVIFAEGAKLRGRFETNSKGRGGKAVGRNVPSGGRRGLPVMNRGAAERSGLRRCS